MVTVVTVATILFLVTVVSVVIVVNEVIFSVLMTHRIRFRLFFIIYLLIIKLLPLSQISEAGIFPLMFPSSGMKLDSV